MMLNDDQSNLLLDRAGLLIILVSWAVLPAVVMWWELTRRRLRAGADHIPARNRTRTIALLPFMPGAPLLALGVCVAGLVPLVGGFFDRWDAGSFAVGLGFFSLGFWGLVTALASIIMWTHLPEIPSEPRPSNVTESQRAKE
jgi:hypothetical protein